MCAYRAATAQGVRQALLKRQAELAQAIAQAEEAWLMLHERLEALPPIN